MNTESVVVPIVCPCCGQAEIRVELIHGDWPEDPWGWDMNDYDADCDCYDFVGQLKGGDEKYSNKLRESALDKRGM